MLILNKDDLEFVAKFPCLLGNPVYNFSTRLQYKISIINVVLFLANKMILLAMTIHTISK